jgi:hypothetical protein
MEFTVKTIDQRLFADPPAIFRTAPLWVWNDRMNEEIIKEHLHDLKENGFGGAFVHPRPGLITEYLSEEWFDLWGTALEEAEKLGLKLYIYDENSYPSGFAGGHVSSQLPDCLANAVIAKQMDHASLLSLMGVNSPMMNRPGHPIQAYAYKKSENTYQLLKDITHIPLNDWNQYGDQFLVFELGAPETNSWLGGFAFTDLMRPEVAELFLSSTYEAYYKRFGDKFGESIPAIFTDEPAVASGGVYETAALSLPFSYWFNGEFEKRNGYDLRLYLPCLFYNVQSAEFEVETSKVRFDYYCTVRELWINNFVKPISEWCVKHNISWTGHYMEHNWPYPWGGMTSPAVMSVYEYMQWPAIDMLMTYLLKENGTDSLMLTIREAHSVANQLNKERVLCETYGAGGWDSTFEDFKRIGDWLMVHGITFMNQHLSFSTIVGARKRDHPQSFDSRQPWWKEYKELADYYARLSYVLSQGATCNRILLLHPTTSGFLGIPDVDDGWTDESENALEMSSYFTLNQWLSDEGFDYDFGDEFILERHGSIKESHFIVGSRSYDLVIIPAEMTHMLGSTVDLLEHWLSSGGRVLALGETGRLIDGLPSGRVQGLADHKNWIRAENKEEMERFLLEIITPRLQWEEKARIPSGVTYLRKDLGDDSTLYFIVNSSPENVSSAVIAEGSHVECWNSWSGCIEDHSYTEKDHMVRIPIELPSCGSILLRIFNQSVNTNIVSEVLPDNNYKELHGTDIQVIPEKDNVLVLDYCDVCVGSRLYKGIHTIYGNRFIYEHHGFDSNPWDNAVQFRKRILDRDQFVENKSGFEATYNFSITEGALPSSLHLYVERTEHYQLLVNGMTVAWEREKDWIDPHFGKADISNFVHEGQNHIKLIANKFSVLLELESIYLRGSFSVNQHNGHWTIDKQNELKLGSWVDQGYPFYEDAVVYKRQISIPESASRVSIRIPSWEGTVATVVVNGRKAGLIGVGEGERMDITPYFRYGENVIEVRICGSFKNLLGPHLDPDKPRRKAWPGNWKNAPMYGPPEAALYDFIKYGLLDEFIVEAYE